MAISKIEEIIEDFRQGKMVILMDDEDRENEGDILMAASMVRPEDINFMAKYGRGLICLTLSKARCKQLNLPLMGDKNELSFLPRLPFLLKRLKVSPPVFQLPIARALCKLQWLQMPNQVMLCNQVISSR